MRQRGRQRRCDNDVGDEDIDEDIDDGSLDESLSSLIVVNRKS